MRAIFAERPRLESWLDILAVLAETQAELGLIPAASARSIREHAHVDRLDLELVARETRSTGHSMLGLIRGLHRVLPREAQEHVYYGATVQDVTDTWTALVMRRVGAIIWRDLHALETRTLELADQHRDTVMVGRTHGQAGAPVTFGWKAAAWADDLRRHVDRLRDGAPRWLVGQLGGAVGAGAFFGDASLELRRRFCKRLGLADPLISWLTARDRIIEFAMTLAMIAATSGRIGNEIYALQRTEVAEVREPAGADAVSSITMPHKRNPEASEHLVTLSRLVAAQAHLLLGSAIQEHERDGRGWKVEWVALPEVCLLTGTAVAFARELLDGLEVDTARMLANVAAQQDELASERVLAALAARMGKHAAQGALQETLAAARRDGTTARAGLMASSEVITHLSTDDLRDLLDAAADTGAAPAMVDAVLERARTARAEETNPWR
ncbi:MAG: class-II fumarase/aspartase family protein [Egibacteraceae bacterium]